MGRPLNARGSRDDEQLPPVCILAGGRGTRLGDLTRDVPKPLVRVAGRPFIEHQLELLRLHGAVRIVLCIGYRGDLIRDAVGDGARFGLEVAYSDEGRRLAGTAGAIRQALALLGESFLVLYGDTYLRIDYRDVSRAFAGSPAPALMTVYRNQGRLSASNAVYANGRVIAFDKASPPPGAEWIDYGLLAFRRSAIEWSDEHDLADVTRRLAKEQLLAGYPAMHRFYEIGTAAGLKETEQFLARRTSRQGRDSSSASVELR